MNYIDLHVHSNVSDGTLTPSEVVKLALDSHLYAFALTDHDTVSGVKEAEMVAKEEALQGRFIHVIPGTELSVMYKGIDIHILGLFIDPNNQTLNEALESARIKRDERNIKMANNLKSAGIDISIDQIRKLEGDAVLTRAHFAKYMVQHGYVKTNKDAFIKYLGTDTPYYVPREYITPKEAIELIHCAGGVAVLAHPLLYKYSLEEIEQLVSYLTDLNLDGIEAIYSSNSGFDEGRMRHFANKYNLAITGGSDFHGANKPDIQIGIGRGNLKIPALLLEKLEEKLKNYKNDKY